nr:hypothetical protein B0A51_12351 [Rachicladosporium sp. CCFEE 5018]OQO25395.1 hypothetical protein B0A51_06989 [Rachicladosporium sp. CCFEE 5018]
MDSGTINPAALNNAPGRRRLTRNHTVLISSPASTISPDLLSQPSPRGTKRNRSPEDLGGNTGGQAANDGKSVKRTKSMNLIPQSPSRTGTMSLAAQSPSVQTPRARADTLPHQGSSLTSPKQVTPGSATKPTMVKALPTVRDHTTDQLGPEGDEYIPREIDPDGEAKVSAHGYPLDNRKYRCRTFQVPNRGEKLFMLATECARILGYRDSYLLFNKNRSLYKIIANQTEKDNLIQQEILPYSYRSRQIAIVTARSMFRQFGARLIENGRKVRDDYWEAKARKQGFTEEDAAGEKRPGAAKAREQQAAREANNNAYAQLGQSEIIYNTNGLDIPPPGLQASSLAPLPMIHIPGDELRSSTYGIIRPRQEITGPPYQDRTQASSAAEMKMQVTQAAEYNKQLGAQRHHREQYLDNYWKRPHEQPVTQSTQVEADPGTVAPQHLQSPQAVAGSGQARYSQDPTPQANPQMMPQTYNAYPGSASSMSPVQTMRPPSQLHQGSPSMSMNPGQQHRQTPSYGGYPQGQMWPQAQPSPLSQAHSLPQYQQHQQPGQMPPPQLPGQNAMAYGQMGGMQNSAYNQMNRNMYQPSPSPQQYNMQSSGAPQSGMQGWTTPGNMQQYGQGFQ